VICSVWKGLLGRKWSAQKMAWLSPCCWIEVVVFEGKYSRKEKRSYRQVDTMDYVEYSPTFFIPLLPIHMSALV
jgi:hypothetical protein